jgi:hypothetical protein
MERLVNVIDEMHEETKCLKFCEVRCDFALENADIVIDSTNDIVAITAWTIIYVGLHSQGLINKVPQCVLLEGVRLNKRAYYERIVLVFDVGPGDEPPLWCPACRGVFPTRSR